MDLEMKVELDSELGNNQGMVVCRKDIEGRVTVDSDHSAKVDVSTGQYHG
jgi:hypothetical protein